MKCNKKFGELGSGIAWVECKGELIRTREHDKTGSVLFYKSDCKKSGNTRSGIVWQR
jgi:hypothetical protein